MRNQNENSTKQIVEILIRMSVLILLFYYCFEILLPFIMPFLWAMVIAVAVNPIHQSLQKKLRGKVKITATIVTILILSFVLVPIGLFISSLSDTLLSLKNLVASGDFHLEKPNPIIESWPIVGKPLFSFLQNASGSISSLFQKYQPEILSGAKLLMLGILGSGITLLQVIFSIIIAGVLLATKGTETTAIKIFERIAGKRGPEFLTLSISTIRNVVKGVLGVAIIQSVLAGTGYYLAAVPHAGIWTLITLVFAIIQVGPSFVIIPIVVYLYTTGNSLFAGLWTIYFVAVIFSDNILKPLLLGKGAEVPTLVIFIGVLGGFILSGFIGLFTGAIFLSIGYKLFLVWLHDTIDENSSNKNN